jgi:hypothetical protein
LLDVIALKHSIKALRADVPYKETLILALTGVLVHTAANIKFGPELYCSEKKHNVEVVGSFYDRVETMYQDLKNMPDVPKSRAVVIQGDSRNLSDTWLFPPGNGFSAVISSPPYPAEHDYTRNSRLELALLEAVVDLASLRVIKKSMLRSDTKGIYSTDADEEAVRENEQINDIAALIDRRAAEKTHGFARLYGKVVKEYFGGMAKHLKSLLPYLTQDANCAYIVGDQASYLGVHVPTSKILAGLAISAGYDVVDIRRWRQRWSSTSRQYLDENILFLRKRRIGGGRHE